MKRQGFQMDDFEIVRSYKESDDKRKQIKILAELNCSTPEMIKKILHENGVATQGSPVKPRQKTKAKVAPVQQKRKEPAKQDVKLSEPAKQDVTLSGVIHAVEQIRQEFCDKYCKYSDLLIRADNDDIYLDLMHSICERCPLN